MAITVVTTSCHSEATVVIVLQYMDLKRKGAAKRSSFTCAKHTGHHLYMLSPEILCCPIKNVLS